MSVTVTNGAGTSAPLAFTYVPAPADAPVLTEIDPAEGPAGGGTTVTVTGTGFTAVSRHGWSVVVFDAEVDFWAVRTGLAETAVALSSDGATRSFEVLLAGEDPASVTDLEAADDGFVVLIRRSKTDQAGVGRKIGIPFGGHPETCPVAAVRAWLEASGIAAGPLFRPVSRHGRVQPARLSDRAVAEVVKRSLRAAGRGAGRYAGHSLRAGFITQAAMAGVSERAIQNQSGHRSLVERSREV